MLGFPGPPPCVGCSGQVLHASGGARKRGQAALFRMTGPEDNLRQRHLRLQPRLTNVATSNARHPESDAMVSASPAPRGLFPALDYAQDAEGEQRPADRADRGT